MPAIQVQHILDRVRDVHQILAAHYRSLSVAVADQKLRLLYGDTADREQRFAEAVNDFEQSAGRDVLTTWVQFVPDDVVRFAREAAGGGPAGSLEEAVVQIQEVNRNLGVAYREVADDTECGNLCELFRNLAALEENNDRHLSRILLEE